MPRRVGNTLVPRNPVIRHAISQRAGVHERSRTSVRQANRAQVRALADDWREELEFERTIKDELNNT